jgi:GcrA cell cycle regulator
LTFISEYRKLSRRRPGGDEKGWKTQMGQINWTLEHSKALREYVSCGMAFSKIANTINKKFKTAYSRNAVIGRAKRLGLLGPDRSQMTAWVPSPLDPPREIRPAEPQWLEFHWPPAALENTKPIKLRCVEIEPRHLVLVELERGDCRYPYGGDSDGEVISFCGHPQRPGSSYCTPHFHLSRNPELPSEEAESTASLHVVEST